MNGRLIINGYDCKDNKNTSILILRVHLGEKAKTKKAQTSLACKRTATKKIGFIFYQASFLFFINGKKNQLRNTRNEKIAKRRNAGWEQVPLNNNLVFCGCYTTHHTRLRQGNHSINLGKSSFSGKSPCILANIADFKSKQFLYITYTDRVRLKPPIVHYAK